MHTCGAKPNKTNLPSDLQFFIVILFYCAIFHDPTLKPREQKYKFHSVTSDFKYFDKK